MVSPVLVSIWFALVVYQIYKWMFQKPPNFPPGKYKTTTKRDSHEQSIIMTIAIFS